MSYLAEPTSIVDVNQPPEVSGSQPSVDSSTTSGIQHRRMSDFAAPDLSRLDVLPTS